MADRELLQAIGELMDEKLDARFGTFEKKMDEKLDARFGTFEKKMDEKLDARFAAFEKKMDEKLDQKMDEKLEPIYTELKNLNNRVKKLELLAENAILPRLQNIEACYISTFERYKNYCDRMDGAFEDIDTLKKTVKEHSFQLQMIS